ncbi:TPA: helix-turn-helix domain-containing protein [Enterococcus faecalis]|uniref:Helix-turn-helix domain-containing protein n=1 Tax=Enterococcus faecalis TaxID=1351 RepID=A0ABD7XRT5_ENTFL|nr:MULTISPECIES: helix-turn-helix domain-containing protein [Enterococcus]EKX6153116.1 helix-turn-helix domain-containing protein [Pseudomonas aeruginosa]CPW56895.1 Helix-turn-helix domain [Mycobacteroides abscessus]EOD87804.1 vrlI protein [Enterococcus faecalis EnGen0065]EOK51348.1 vrlI protein [Enterococcus faecalis EnGen0064]EPR47309.1 vrlI protein [Enterococcus faecalis 10244]
MALEVIDFRSKKIKKNSSKKIPPLKAIEVAKRKNVSAATVTRWMKREIDPLPAKRNGGLVRIEVDDLEEWYDRNFI